MKITRKEIRELVKEELLYENKKVHVSSADRHKIKINYSKEHDSVNINVETPDGYPWSIERIPLSVAKEIVKGLNKL